MTILESITDIIKTALQPPTLAMLILAGLFIAGLVNLSEIMEMVKGFKF